MRGSLLEPQGVSSQDLITKVVSRRKRSVFVLSCITNNRKFNIDLWGLQDTTTHVLHKSSFLGCWSKIPTHGEDGLLINYVFEEASSILPCPYHHSYDGPTNPKSYEQTRCCRSHGLMGCWAKPVWYWVRAKNNNQTLSFSGFYYRIHSFRICSRSKVLDNLRRWIIYCRAWRCRYHYDVTQEGPPQVWGSTPVPNNKQRGGV